MLNSPAPRDSEEVIVKRILRRVDRHLAELEKNLASRRGADSEATVQFRIGEDNTATKVGGGGAGENTLPGHKASEPAALTPPPPPRPAPMPSPPAQSPSLPQPPAAAPLGASASTIRSPEGAAKPPLPQPPPLPQMPPKPGGPAKTEPLQAKVPAPDATKTAVPDPVRAAVQEPARLPAKPPPAPPHIPPAPPQMPPVPQQQARPQMPQHRPSDPGMKPEQRPAKQLRDESKAFADSAIDNLFMDGAKGSAPSRQAVSLVWILAGIVVFLVFVLAILLLRSSSFTY